MRRATLTGAVAAGCAAVALVAVAGVSAGRDSAEVAPGQLSMTPIKAVFLPAPDYATKYTFTFKELNPKAKVTINWYLYLELIDPKGQPAPDLPDSGAEYDPLCANKKFPGLTDAYSGPDHGSFSWSKLGKTQYIWYHGDQGVYTTPPGYGCDHKSMGPRGHQGTVSVEMYDNKGWVCHARYYGTNNGTSDKPRCERAGLPPNADVLTKTAIYFEREAIKELQTPAHSPDKWRHYVRVSLDELDGAIADVKADAFPGAEDVVGLLQSAKKDDVSATAPQTGAQRIRDLEQGIQEKQAALKLIQRDS